ncbi:MAG: hypothetical protein ACRDH9_11830 [Actinomycetota bacterium]
MTRPMLVCAMAMMLGATALAENAGAEVTSRWDAMRTDAFGRIEAAEALLETGSMSDAVRAAASLVRVVPDPTADAVVEGVGDTEATLLGAVLRAGDLATEAVRATPTELATLDRRSRLLAPTDIAGSRQLLAHLDVAVDRPMLYGAATDLARAIELALGNRSHDLGAASGSASCDVQDQPPLLCVAGEGPNVHTEDYALLIDRGGNDVYTNSAGAGDPTGNGLPVSVVMDLAGNDKYESSVPASTGARVVQGAGNLGGIGFLVDVAGDDRYEATAARSSISVQGAGIAGVGMLADLAGSDRYSAINETDAATDSSTFTSVHAQGHGSLGGAGLLLDRGGDDTLLLRSNPRPVRCVTSCAADNILHAGKVSAEGLGYGNLGAAAIVALDGGTDTATMEIISGPVAPDEAGPFADTIARAWGVGFGVNGGAGFAHGGDGANTWQATVETTTPIDWLEPIGGNLFTIGIGAQWLGHGMAQTAGLGAITDPQGNDAYLVDVTSTSRRVVTAEDACNCGRAEEKLHGAQSAAFTIARGSGAGSVGAIRDASGNDRYSSRVTTRTDLEVRDNRSVAPIQGDPLARAFGGAAVTNGQALGHQGGAGFLHDLGGNDVYESIVTNEAIAKASAALPALDARSQAEAHGSVAKSLAQGAGDADGYGELRDLGGDDVYRAINSSLGTATPPTHADGSPILATVQGAAELLGMASFLDVGGTDTFVSIPDEPTFAGSRGAEGWVDEIVTVAGPAPAMAGGTNR